LLAIANADANAVSVPEPNTNADCDTDKITDAVWDKFAQPDASGHSIAYAAPYALSQSDDYEK
jgi:hypothetical protein